MARQACTKYVNCNLQGMSLDEILKSLFVKDANGCYYINTVVNSDECDAVTPALECGSPETLRDMFAHAVVLDSCNRPALAMFYYAPQLL